MRGLGWKGKRFDESFPADQINRIVHLRASGFARDSDATGEQADFEALFADLLDLKETATDRPFGGNEGTQAELVIITKEGEIFRVDVIGTPATPSSPAAIRMNG